MMIKGIAIVPNSKNSKGFNWIPKHIIPSFNIYDCVNSKPFIISLPQHSQTLFEGNDEFVNFFVGVVE